MGANTGLHESQAARTRRGVKSSKIKALSPWWKLFLSVHLHLRLRPCINSNREVEPDIDDGKEEEEEEGRDEEERFSEHGAVWIGELQLEVLDVCLRQKLSRTSGQNNNSPSSGVQICVMFSILSSRNRERCVQLKIRHTLGQDDLDLSLLDQHVVVDVIDQAHVEHVDVALVEDVLVAGHIVADNIMGFPAAKEGKPWTQVKFHCIVHHLGVGGELSTSNFTTSNLEMAGADVANVIPVVDILGSSRQKGLEVLHARHPAVLALELITGEGALDENNNGMEC